MVSVCVRVKEGVNGLGVRERLLRVSFSLRRMVDRVIYNMH